tara:strand:+ start:523 stop:807 length:285 start_codon:yes stop_codon:yes gene_type:complete
MQKKITSKVSKALFTKFGGKGLLFKDGNEFEVSILILEKTFEVGNKLLTTAPKIRIYSEEKPEIYNQLSYRNKVYKVKSSPKLIGDEVYEINLN